MAKEIKKSKVKVNAFDIFVILLVLCLIATIAYKVYTSVSSDDNTKNSEITVTFRCDGEYDSILKYLNEGDQVYLKSGELLGYIHKNADSKELFVVTQKSTSETDDTDAAEQNTADTTDSTVYTLIEFTGEIKLNGNAVKSNKGTYYIIGEDNITVGGKLELYTKRTEFTVTVTGFGEIDKY